MAPTLLRAVVATWMAVRGASRRLEKRRLMAQLFAQLGGAELRLAASYLAGELDRAPPGIGWATLAEARQRQGAPAGAPLALLEIDEVLGAVGALAGPGSNARRLELLGALLERADTAEREFLTALVTGELRQGALRALVLEAIADARSVEVAALRRSVMLAGSLGTALAALERGELADVALRPLVPVEPMLAGTAGALDETLAELGGVAAAEWKLDGVRIQLHRDGEEVRVFTRSLRDITHSSPELVALARSLPAARFILDGEAVADSGDGPMPFQDLMSTFTSEAHTAARPIEARFFDLLYQDDAAVIDRPDDERRRLLAELVPPSLLVPRRLVHSAEEIEAALEEALAHGHEGLVLKAPGAVYTAGRRGANWRKVKRATTIDLVVLAAEWGHGRRRGWLSNLHLGARDTHDPSRFWMLGKTFKGLTDAMLSEQTAALLELAVEQTPSIVRVRPERVVEIAFDDVLRSTRYDSGMALRFARVKRFRPDKLAREATTVDELRARVGGERPARGA